MANDLSPWAQRMPSPTEEIWRYSRINELDISAFNALPCATETPGTFEHTNATTNLDVFAEMNAEFGTALHINIAAGKVITEPIVITHRITTNGSASFPRLVIDAGADSEFTVVERFVSDDVVGLIAPVLELNAGPAARVKYLTINELGPQVWCIGSQVATSERDSTILLANVALGGYYARMRTDARLVGKGATADQIAVYFGDGDQMHDFRTSQEHAAPKTFSNLLFKGAVQGTSRSVYTGNIRIDHDAPGCRAYQTNRTIKLSDHSWAESVPNLDILNNDVQCSHASAVSPIDEQQRFYLASRGVAPHIADRLIVTGFFDEVFDRLPVPSLVPGLRHAVANKLQSLSTSQVAA